MRLLLFVILLLIFLVAIMFVIWETMKHRIKLQDQKWQEKNKLKELDWQAKVLEQKIKFREDSFFRQEEIADLQNELNKVNEIIKNIKERK